MEVQIGCIVEGHGEVSAVPLLIRRVAQELQPALQVKVLPPLRNRRNLLVKPGELERAVELAARKLGGKGALLILLDADDDCPKELAPELLRRATQARGDLPIAVVLAMQEFEAWFLAAATSLRGYQGLPADLAPPPQPERFRGAKEWLNRQGITYSPAVDQARLAARFDLALARQNAPSFDKCYRDIARLLQQLQAASPHLPS